VKEELVDFCLDNGIDAYAAKLLESLVRENQKRGDLLFKLGKTYENMGENTKAVTFLAQVSELDKANVDIKIHLAKNYLSLDKPILAERTLKEILKIDPEHEEAKELIKSCT
jgi:tetratricopeptide (TPR) repeat protein